MQCHILCFRRLLASYSVSLKRERERSESRKKHSTATLLMSHIRSVFLSHVCCLYTLTTLYRSSVALQTAQQSLCLRLQLSAQRFLVFEKKNKHKFVYIYSFCTFLLCNFLQEREIRESVKRDYDDLVSNLFSTSFALKNRFEEYRLSLYEDVVQGLFEVRKV